MIKKYNSFLLEKYKSNLLLLLESEVYGSSDFILKLQSLSKEVGKTGEIAQAINDIIDDKNKLIHFDKEVYAIWSNPILLPNEYNELPIEEKVDLLYKIIYDEFIRLEKEVYKFYG